KLIKPEIASDKKTIERFSNELKMARKIAHRNVGRMYHLSEHEGTHYITMEYVPGEDLKSSIRRMGPLGAGKTAFIAKQVCEGLAEAHRLGVIHRDLKPQNIMIDKDGNARIMDFGIARSVKGKGITGAGVMVGTPEYMSPEQAEMKEVDRRSDIYSLGVILYEMVTGRVPFEGETPLGIAMKHKSEDPQNPKEINAQIPDDISRLILKCMEKNKEKRYQSAAGVLSELTRIEEGIPSTERVVPKKKPITPKEITVTLGLKKLLIPALVVIAVAIIAIIIWQLIPQKEAVSPEIPSIAVLPFKDLSPQKDQEYFCDGMSEALINAMTNIKELKVIARNSAFSFKGKEQSLSEMGKKLNVGTVLEGSVQKVGNRLRITAKLINVEDGVNLLSEMYDREMQDVFTIQDEISLAIIDKLKVQLLGDEKVRLVKRHTENLEAYNLYLKGRYFWNKRTDEEINKAVEYFERAIEIDPKFAPAYAGIADSYISLAWLDYLSPRVAYKRARKEALKAIEVDDTVGEAYVSLANIKAWLDWDIPGAEQEFKRAIVLNPSNAEAHHQYSHLLAAAGRFEEAIDEMKQALELEPLSIIINSCMGQTLYFARKYDEAIEQLQKAIEMDPNYHDPQSWRGMAYIEKGMPEKAIEKLQKDAPSIGITTRWIAAIGYAYAELGRRDEALRIIDQLKNLSAKRSVDPYFISWIYASLGQKDPAFDWLNKAIDARSGFIVYLNVDPVFDSIRSDPRFKDLLSKAGLKK
ncbi:MAG: protein kinase, partial [Candidatus Aminicenantes bacterium]|nr:protein kinase [Candidatus Aminicenantes bacterium]